MSDWTGMGLNTPAPQLDPNCQCICHTQPGVMHVAACCSAPDAALLQARADAAAAQALMVERAAELADDYGAGPSLIEDIRRLAPDAGTAELAKLRERAEKAERQRDALIEAEQNAHPTMCAMRRAENLANARAEALAASPDVAKLVAAAEARGMERAAGLFTAKPWTWNAHEIQEKIRAEAAAMRRAAE